MRKAQRIYYKLNIKSFTFDPMKHTDSRSLCVQGAIIYTALNLIADSSSLYARNTRFIFFSFLLLHMLIIQTKLSS
jgi:hypothetical protein